MTQLLFRHDAYATTFTAVVEATEGTRVRLDRTLYYPESGGQASDTGTIHWAGGTARVTDVQKTPTGVWHTLEGALPPVGTDIHGELNWRARYRHMQRHTGEHLLAQAFLRVNPSFQVAAVSMRSAQCTLDLRGNPGDDDARAAERLLLDVIARDLRIETLEVPDTQLAQYPLRRPPQVQGTVRLVGVRDANDWWEMSACGGTHLKSTAFVAPVVILGLERVKGGLTRVTFMTGEEATEYLGRSYRELKSAAQRLSVPTERVVERLDVTLDETTRLRGELERAHAGWARSLALSAPHEPWEDGTTLRVASVPDGALVTPTLKTLLDCPNTLGVAVSPDGRCGVSSSIPGVHAGRQLQAWLAVTGGRGGGKEDFAQGQTVDAHAFEQAARATVTST